MMAGVKARGFLANGNINFAVVVFISNTK